MSDPARRRFTRFHLAVLLLVALVPAAYVVILHRSDPPSVAPPVEAVQPTPALPPAPAIVELRLVESSGDVEIRRGSGEFEKALVGRALQADDTLRVVGGEARLSAGPALEVEIEPGTQLAVQELTATLTRLMLENGMLLARVDATKGGRALEVAAAGSDAVARTRDGAFAMSSNGEGTVAVGARAGEVDFAAGGKAVRLRKGFQSVAQAPGGPSEPTAFPSSLLLKVGWPPDTELNRRQLTVAGRTTPGAVVVVAGRIVKVLPDGRFKASLKLREGKNAVRVEGLDVAGNRVPSQAEFTVDTTAPDSQIPTNRLWEK